MRSLEISTLKYETIETRYDSYGEYEWRTLHVSLTSVPLLDVITPMMNAEQLEMFNILMETHGNSQFAASPFDFAWLPLVTSGFGYRIHPISGERDMHRGIDIAVPIGTEIRSGVNGFVSTIQEDASYGKSLVIQGYDGSEVKYAHLSEVLVSYGDEVSAGDVVALSGNTGNSTGPHLHYEVLVNGIYLDPMLYTAAGQP